MTPAPPPGEYAIALGIVSSLTPGFPAQYPHRTTEVVLAATRWFALVTI